MADWVNEYMIHMNLARNTQMKIAKLREKHFRSFCWPWFFRLYFSFFTLVVFGMRMSPQLSFIVLLFCYFCCCWYWFYCLGARLGQMWVQCFRQFYFSQTNTFMVNRICCSELLWPRHCMCEHGNNYSLCCMHRHEIETHCKSKTQKYMCKYPSSRHTMNEVKNTWHAFFSACNVWTFGLCLGDWRFMSESRWKTRSMLML